MKGLARRNIHVPFNFISMQSHINKETNRKYFDIKCNNSQGMQKWPRNGKSQPGKHSSWWRRLEDVLKASFVFVFKRRPQDVLMKTNIFLLIIRLQKTSSRRLGQDQYIRLGYTSSRRLQDVFKTSSRRLAKTSSRHLQDVFKTYHQVKLFLLTSLWEVFNMFVRRTAKTVVYRRIHLGHTSEKFMVSVQNLQVLVFQFTTPFSGCL